MSATKSIKTLLLKHLKGADGFLVDDHLINYFDYLDHCVYTKDEIITSLRELEADGKAQYRDDRWFIITQP